MAPFDDLTTESATAMSACASPEHGKSNVASPVLRSQTVHKFENTQRQSAKELEAKRRQAKKEAIQKKILEKGSYQIIQDPKLLELKSKTMMSQKRSIN